jgi:hypothetical protein
MTPHHSTFQLWLLGVVWTLGPWLALGFAAILATLVVQRVSRLARSIEKKPVERGAGGFVGLVRDGWIHGALARSTLFIVMGCLMFAGFIAAGIQGFVQRSVQETLRGTVEEEWVVQPGPVPDSSGDGFLDLIILGGLMMACVTVIIGVSVYRRLRRRAEEIASRPTSRGAPKPVVVRLFYDNKKIGITILVVGCWMLWGFLSQVVGLAIYTFPGASSLGSIPGVETAAIVFLVILGIAMFIAMFAPLAWLSFRNARLQLRYMRENRVARRVFYAQVVVFCGLLGSALNLYLIDVLGRLLWPSVFDR